MTMMAKTLKFFLLTLITVSSAGVGQMVFESWITNIKTLVGLENPSKDQIEEIFNIDLADQNYKNIFFDGDESFTVLSGTPRHDSIIERVELRKSKKEPSRTILISMDLKQDSLQWRDIEKIPEWQREPGINLDAGGRLIVIQYTIHNGSRVSFSKIRESNFVNSISINYQTNAE